MSLSHLEASKFRTFRCTAADIESEFPVAECAEEIVDSATEQWQEDFASAKLAEWQPQPRIELVCDSTYMPAVSDLLDERCSVYQLLRDERGEYVVYSRPGEWRIEVRSV